MADYGWKGRTDPTKDFPKGLSKGLRTLNLSGKKVEKVDIEAGQADGTTQMFRCSVVGCGKIFKARHPAAGHFRGKHKELNVEKDSWRSYVDAV